MRVLWWFRSPYVRCFSVNHVTCERVKGAIAAPFTIPAPGNFVFGLFPPAIGSGVILDPCRSRPLGASLRLAPAYGQRLSDFQPDSGVAVSLIFSSTVFIADFVGFVGPCKRSAAGRGLFPLPFGERGRVRGIHRTVTTSPGGGYALPGLQTDTGFVGPCKRSTAGQFLAVSL